VTEEKENLRDLMSEERSRGTKRPRRAKEIEADRLILEGVAKAIGRRDVRPLLDALRKAGWKDDSPEFLRAVKEFANAVNQLRQR
jgi:hypothetical protein